MEGCRCSSVREVTAEDLADIAANPVDVEAELAAIGASGGFGEAGQSTTARTYAPSFPLYRPLPSPPPPPPPPPILTILPYSP